MKSVVFEQPGGPEVLSWGHAPDPAPGRGEVLVRVKAAGVNRADVLQRMGRYPPPAGASSVLGLELAGEVVAAGPGATRFPTHSRIMALVPGGGYAAYAAVPEVTAMPVPSRLSWAEAAAIPEAFLTAWVNLFDLGALEPEQTVFLHAGGSGVGTAVIQLAREAGARLLTVAGTEEKAALCSRLGAERVFLRGREDLVAGVREATGGSGVDLVLDMVGVPAFAANLDMLRPGGRLVLIGFLGGSHGEMDLGSVLRKSLTVRGTTLRGSSLEQKAIWMEDFVRFALPRFEDGRLAPVVDRVFPITEATAAHARMEENRNAGKIVLTVE
jgi:putative PIG3 family NAD(P)H quinone oxidoreductase